MKNILILCLTLLASSVHAQTFEGTINWSMKTEITDPKMKAQMEEAQKRMSDPAQQAKMKEMQARMNDPQMKAMMEANPQMKAQMENVMKGGDMSSMMPTGMKIKIKGGNTLSAMEGGMAMEILYLKDKDQSYNLNRPNKTYTILPSGGGAAATTNEIAKPKITKTSETAKILNYTCTKYIVEVTEHGKPVTQILWSTTEIKDIDMKSIGKQRMSRGSQTISYEGVDGVPLKIEMTTPEMTMVMEVTAIKKETLPSSDFSIADFKEVKNPYMKN